ncbi:NHL domain-containing protein [Actinomycetospora aeridis]|uniref:SMP-30/gluconolactonase/LRE family protein n=1 Tax=Actinomycetospora aeridis TaxID=3129231 RepID=A0ABU8MYK0_9PSEU
MTAVIPASPLAPGVGPSTPSTTGSSTTTRARRASTISVDPALGYRAAGPLPIAINGDDDLFLADGRVYRLRPNGTGTVVVGQRAGRWDGKTDELAKELYYPGRPAFDAAGNVYVPDSWNHVIKKIAVDGTISVFAGRWLARGSGPGVLDGDGGPATAAGLNRPRAVAVDKDGVVYIADTDNRCLRKVALDGVISTMTWTAEGDLGAGGGTVTWARGLAMNAAGTALYICDTANHRVLRLDLAAKKLRRVAGGNGSGPAGDGGPADRAQLSWPVGVALDGEDNLFIADTSNHRVRMVTPKGAISTVAGTGSPRDAVGADRASATAVALANPTGVAVDSRGSLFITCFGAPDIRRVDLPTFSVPTATAYDFGTGAFSVLALVCPDVIPGAKPDEAQRGNLVSRHAPYRKGGGWALTLVVDPPKRTAGRYVVVTLYAGDGTQQEMFFRLDDAALKGQVDGKVVALPDGSTRFQHTVVFTRDATGTCRLYLDAASVDPVEPAAVSTADVSSTAPLDLDRILPVSGTAPQDQEPGDTTRGLVRAAFLWAGALSATDVVNVTRLVTNPRINVAPSPEVAPTYAATVSYAPPTSDDVGYTVTTTGTTAIVTPEGKAVSRSSTKTGELQPTLREMKRRAAKLITNFDVDDTQLATYRFGPLEPKPGTTSSTMTVTGLPDPDEAPGPTNKETTETETFVFGAPRDPGDVHWTTYRDAGKESGDLVDAAPEAADCRWEWNDNPAFSYFRTDLDVAALPGEKCVGAWHLRGRAPGSIRLGRDLSPTGNHLPPEQVLDPADLDTVLPFYVQTQRGVDWCWAATSVSVATFYRRGRRVPSQEDLVTASARDLAWSFWTQAFDAPLGAGAVLGEHNPEKFDYPNRVTPPLTRLGIFAEVVERQDLKGARDAVREGRPVLARLTWERSSPTAPDPGSHFVVLTGTYTARAEGKQPEPMLVVSDPFHGVTAQPESTFPASYHQGASWQDTVYTRPAWAADT